MMATDNIPLTTSTEAEMDDLFAAVAEAVGVLHFRWGRQILRDERRQRIAEIFVEYGWHALITPSDGGRAVVGVANTCDYAYRDKPSPAFFRAGIAIQASADGEVAIQSEAIDITHDPVRDAFRSQSIESIAASDTDVSGDVGDELHIFFRHPNRVLTFSNSAPGPLREVEDAIVQVAAFVAERSMNERIDEFLQRWKSKINLARRNG